LGKVAHLVPPPLLPAIALFDLAPKFETWERVQPFFGVLVLYPNILTVLISGPSVVNPLPPSDAVRKQKKIFQRIFSVQYCHHIKKYHPSGNLKCHYLGIFQSFKFRILMEKTFQRLLSLISLQILWAVMG